MNYDLEERSAKFGENVIEFIKSIQTNDILKPLFHQLIRSSTSIGANYMEANYASSKRDFRNKIAISTKESNETKYWLRMIAKASPEKADICRKLWKEAHELTLIFAKIKRNSL
ncbi:four helix bundle protein [Candidatus Peregrinibacteria bacterium]|nr:four helix bundle protein [Candidatus Peregrinibacteria bacterium]